MATVIIEMSGAESVSLHKHYGTHDLRIDRQLVVQMDSQDVYERVRRQMADAFGLIVPEDAAAPEQIMATATGTRKTAVAAAV